jgi:hypothetical protein
MDRHDVPGASAEEIAAAHSQDVGIQSAHGVRYLTYWFEPDSGSVFCLAEGPTIEAVEQVHREAHGQMAGNIIEVEPGPVQAFFGSPRASGRNRLLGIGGTGGAVHRHLRVDGDHRAAR